jgi:hypothetical protein
MEDPVSLQGYHKGPDNSIFYVDSDGKTVTGLGYPFLEAVFGADSITLDAHPPGPMTHQSIGKLMKY